jgi:uridine kinase
VTGLNERISRGEFPDIVIESEAAYDLDVEYAAEMVASRRDELKMVIITGPSSSGKTTTTFKLRQRLGRMGLKLVTLNVDNYFYDLELHPKDEFGDYDFETPQALDLALINEHLLRLIEGNEVLIPYYDFKTGRRYNDHSPLKLIKDDILLIDSLHGLYPDMTKAVSEDYTFKLYLEPLLQMKDPQGKFVQWTDLRLIRRMLRDSAHRAYDPRMTLEHWHYVRSSEMRNIIPHINQTDFIVNSGMPYELPLYRARLYDQFVSWVKELEDNALRVDAYMRASRVTEVLDSVLPVKDDTAVPLDSVLREFIGGSCYEY